MIFTWLRVFVVLCFLSPSIGFAAETASDSKASQDSKLAPDFSLRSIDNESVSLSNYRGKVVVISFWATWCGPCKEEMPHLQRLLNEHRDKGLEVLSISTDDQRAGSQVKPYIKQKQYDFTVLRDPNQKAIIQYNPSKTLPFTVIIDRNGQIAKVHSGYNPGDEEELFRVVKGLLGESVPAPEKGH